MSSRSDVVSLDACGIRVVDRERVAAVQDAMPPAEDVEQAADVFALLGDPSRLRLLVALLAGGEMCVCDLAVRGHERVGDQPRGPVAAGAPDRLRAPAAGPDDVLPAGRCAPEGYAPGDIVAAIVSRPEVASVHDVHVWLITSGFPALSAHVLVRRPPDCHQARRDLERLLCDRLGLDHTTLQVDHAPEEMLTIGSDQL